MNNPPVPVPAVRLRGDSSSASPFVLFPAAALTAVAFLAGSHLSGGPSPPSAPQTPDARSAPDAKPVQAPGGRPVARPLPEPGGLVRISADVASAIRQGDTEGCGPVSLLNLLKLGTAAHRGAFADIAGGDEAKALERLAARYCSPDGKDGRPRFHPDKGINDANLARLGREVARAHGLPVLDALWAVRKSDEPARDFARRVNDALVASLAAEVPVVISIDSYGVKGGKWRKLTGHYMLATGVQRLGPGNPRSFLLEYVNPAGGAHRHALVHADDRKHPGAWAHLADGDKWVEDRPYLCMASPYTELGRGSLPAESRHEFFLTFLIGSWPAPAAGQP